jgi:hypothetical protein
MVPTGESSKLEEAFDRWKELIPMMINVKGEMVKELSRTTALNYSVYSINALMQVAEIAYHHGIDLYAYKLSNDIGLEKALDFHTKYVSDSGAPQKWLNDGYKQSGDYDGSTNGNAPVYELAHTRIGMRLGQWDQ